MNTKVFILLAILAVSFHAKALALKKGVAVGRGAKARKLGGLKKGVAVGGGAKARKLGGLVSNIKKGFNKARDFVRFKNLKLRRLAKSRRLSALVDNLKKGLKATLHTICEVVIDCVNGWIQEQIGLGKAFKELPGLKWVRNKLVGAAMDAFATHLKAIVDKGIDAAVNALRRRRRLTTAVQRNTKARRLWWGFNTAVNWFKKAGSAITAAAKKAATAVAGMAKEVGNIANQVGNSPFFKKLKGLAGAALTALIKSGFCWGFTELMNLALVAAFNALGCEFIQTMPPCVKKAITGQCQKLVNSIFKRRLMSDIRRLKRDIKLNF